MHKNLKNYIVALVMVNLVLTPTVYAAENDTSFLRHVGGLVSDRVLFAQFLRGFDSENENSQLATIQRTSLVAPHRPNIAKPITRPYGHVVVTAYSSSADETDETPFITAAGTQTRDGVVAANFLPFGTKVQLPDLFGDKIFVVEDRMNRRYSNRIDVWFPSKWEAKQFGKRLTLLVIVD